MRITRCGVESAAEYLIALILILGAVSVILADPMLEGGPLVRLLGSNAAGNVYGAIFFAVGGMLISSKLKGWWPGLRAALTITYITIIFTFFLELFLIGLTYYLLDSVILIIIVTYLRLRRRKVELKSTLNPSVV